MANSLINLALLIIGALFLRQAYRGERPLAIVTLSHSEPEKMTSSEKFHATLLGVGYIVIALASLIALVWKNLFQLH